MILEILKYPDERLKKVCAEVDEVTTELRELVANMVETMYAANGVGLAAPQVGVLKRLIVIDPSGPKEKSALRVLVNPRLTLIGDFETYEEEGCLSVSMDYRSAVARSEKVRLEAEDMDGNKIDEEVDGFQAIVLQHECDHLDGKLFIDHISRLKRTLYDTKLKKWTKKQQEEKSHAPA